jgi:hypothetical protein
MACTSRLNNELKQKAEKLKQTAKNPVELLRAHCLARGASGIKGLGRYISSVYISSLFFNISTALQNIQNYG